ncbi:hypothetical protein [Microbacterium ureisolvens]|uniref:1,4-alpha-glucan branching enzyme n=1 Tax=Microbacterium ureisolvens TaxID=2781186 RepID=A0ABS7HU82_9MICO|nr:hypothetical protein [Microbacterium ureisolvens]MBW9108911.1 hypothetical protein [Microbacterium ureisolvens]
MNDHTDRMDTPEQNARAEEPIGATRREQREREAADPRAGTQADARQNYAQTDMSRENADREAAARTDAARYDAGESSEAAAHEPAAHTATTDHDVIRQWAADRHAMPATVEGTEHGGNVGELRLDFDFGNDLEDLRQVSWDEWFRAFDERGLEFVFQETPRPDGSPSNDFHLEPAGHARI